MFHVDANTSAKFSENIHSLFQSDIYSDKMISILMMMHIFLCQYQYAWIINTFHLLCVTISVCLYVFAFRFAATFATGNFFPHLKPTNLLIIVQNLMRTVNQTMDTLWFLWVKFDDCWNLMKSNERRFRLFLIGCNFFLIPSINEWYFTFFSLVFANQTIWIIFHTTAKKWVDFLVGRKRIKYSTVILNGRSSTDFI